jgi:hypothetical protein
MVKLVEVDGIMRTLAGVGRAGTPRRDGNAALFSAIEHQVLCLAWREVHVMSVRKSWLDRLMDRLTPTPASLPLANGRLETLRRAAVSFGLGKEDLDRGALADAGFCAAQIAVLHDRFGSLSRPSAAA